MQGASESEILEAKRLAAQKLIEEIAEAKAEKERQRTVFLVGGVGLVGALGLYFILKK